MARRKDSPGAKTAGRRKRTLCLSVETSIRLSVEAERRGIDRSACAELLLAEALRHIVIQVRGVGAKGGPALAAGTSDAEAA